MWWNPVFGLMLDDSLDWKTTPKKVGVDDGDWSENASNTGKLTLATTHCYLPPSWFQVHPLGRRGWDPWGQTCSHTHTHAHANTHRHTHSETKRSETPLYTITALWATILEPFVRFPGETMASSVEGGQEEKIWRRRLTKQAWPCSCGERWGFWAWRGKRTMKMLIRFFTANQRILIISRSFTDHRTEQEVKSGLAGPNKRRRLTRGGRWTWRGAAECLSDNPPTRAWWRNREKINKCFQINY